MSARVRAPLAVVLSAVFALAGCGDDDGAGPVTPPPPPPPPALQITERTPAPNATAVETGATVTVTFNQPIDPATLTPATFRVRSGGVALPAAINYEASILTATVSAPLLPGGTYEVEVTTGVQTLADAPLADAAAWTFTTRPMQAVTVDTSSVSSPAVVVDGNGRVHLSYFADGLIQYALCSAACTAFANWQGAAVAGAGSVTSVSIAVDGLARVHLTYFDDRTDDLAYSTCPGVCTTTANWQTVAPDTTGAVGFHSSVAVDGDRRVHVSYMSGLALAYATCAAACATFTNWQALPVDSDGVVGQHTSLAVDISGRFHVSYFDLTNADLKYATCAAACTTAANWQVVRLDMGGSVGFSTSLAFDPYERLHVTYWDATKDDLKYATCATACTTLANWQTVAVDTAGIVGSGTSLAVDGWGRLHVTYYDETKGDLKYATCAVSCGTAANWRTVTLDGAGIVGSETSLAVARSGRLHVSYRDIMNGALKYIE